MAIPRKTIPVRRIIGSQKIKGKWYPGTSTLIDPIKSTIQVSSPNDLLALPEGRRTANSFNIYTSVVLNTELEGDGDPDEVQINSEWYVVVTRGRWNNLKIGKNRYIVQRKTVK